MDIWILQTTIVSAHRTPERMYDFAKSAKDRGVEVIIAGAGGAAHLPGKHQSKKHTHEFTMIFCSKFQDQILCLLVNFFFLWQFSCKQYLNCSVSCRIFLQLRWKGGIESIHYFSPIILCCVLESLKKLGSISGWNEFNIKLLTSIA